MLYGSLIMLYGSLIMLYGSLIMLYFAIIRVEHTQTYVLIMLYGSLIMLYIEQNQSRPEWKYEYALPSLEGIFACRAKSI